MSVPELRFPEFAGELIKRRISDFAVVKTGSRDTQDRIDIGQYPFFVRSNTIERINSFAFDGEAILTSGDGVGVGKNIHYIDGKFDYHQRVYAIREFTMDVDGKFFFQFFREKFLRRVMRLSAKNSVDSVRMSMITEMAVTTPPLPEQKKIAAFLGAVDDKVAALRDRQAGLERYKRGLMQALFSQRLRFTKPDGTPFPDWEEKLVIDCLDLSAITGTDGSVAKKLTVKLWGKGVFAKNEKIMGSVNTQYYTRKAGQFIYSKLDFLNCAFGVIPLELDGYESTVDLPTFDFKVGIIPPFFLERVKQLDFYERLGMTADGSRKARRIQERVFLSFPIDLPHPDEQQKIADALSAMDTKIQAVADHVTQMQTFKKGLLQQMFV